jgi:biopolymer transport protein ExbD
MKNVRTVEVDARGNYMMAKRPMPLEQLINQVSFEYRANPRLIIYIRADENGPYKHVAAILDRLEAAGVSQVSLRTQLPKRK